jgi:endonuclease/exonuclease/phosphatase family metal-dependent hydrolase
MIAITSSRVAGPILRVVRVAVLTACALAVPGLGPQLAQAQWNPQAGQYGKSTPTDLRVMTWNVRKAINSQATKSNTVNAWNATARIVAALKPDIIMLQECGGLPNDAGVDNVNTLTNVFNLWIHGGFDPHLGGAVGSYVQMFDPGLDYPYIFVSASTDGFNRNVILSRYPFQDLTNTPATTTLSDVVVFGADAYAPGGNGGVRGYQFAEIGLPDDIYAGDVVIGNGHLKAYSGCADQQQRETAARNIAYFIDYFYNGAGTGVPDPNNRIPWANANSVLLDDNTPVIWGGDLNQPLTGSGCWTKNPVRWLAEAQAQGGADGTNRDRSDSAIDTAAEPITGNITTQGSTTGGQNNKIDYILWQSSIATAVRQFVFNSNLVSNQGAPLPVPVNTFPGFPSVASSTASDHRPVIVDFSLPLAPDKPKPCPGDLNGDGQVNADDLGVLLSSFGCAGEGCLADLTGDGQVNADDLGVLLSAFGSLCP